MAAKASAHVKKRNRIKTNGINPRRFSRGQIKFHAFLIPLCIFMGLPIVFIFMQSLKPLDELFAYPPRFYVKDPTLQNFKTLFSLSAETDIPATRYLFNSIIVAVVNVVGNILIAVATAYVLSLKTFKGKKTLFAINTAALSFASIAVAIPRYFVMVFLGLNNNFLAHIIPLLVSPTCVFLVKQFMDQLPPALVEAAIIDGAGDFTIIRKIIIPLVKPALATVVIMSFQSAWGATEASTMYINDETMKTFAFYLSTLSASGSISGAGVAAASSLIMFLPNLIIFIFSQSKVMNTMSHSGIK